MSDVKPSTKTVDFAVSDKEYRKFGCPVCGFATSKWHFSGSGGLLLSCENDSCKSTFFVLLENYKAFGGGMSFYVERRKKCNPELKTHPRKNTPTWGKRRDKRPSKTSEFFTNPIMSSDYNNGLCFICKTCCRLPVDVEWPMKNLFSVSFEARCQKSAKRIRSQFEKMGLLVNLTGKGFEYPPSFYFVTVSSCFTHKPNLLELQKIAEEQGVINKRIISKIKALK